jgi:ABC-2 type transport system permease protein
MSTPLNSPFFKFFRVGGIVSWKMIKNSVYHPQILFLDFIFLFFRCGLLLCLYKCVYDWKGGDINHTRYVLVAWSMFLFFALSNMRIRDVSGDIAEDIRTGNIETLLNKPIGYLNFRFWYVLGGSLYYTAILAPLGILTMWLTIGIPSTMTTAFFVLSCLMAIILGTILTFLIWSVVGLASFWIEDIEPLEWLVGKLATIVGGSYLPVAFFPTWMRQLSTGSPFGAMNFVTYTVYPNWIKNSYGMLGMQLMWIIIFGLVLYFVYNKAQKYVSVNGG